MCCMGLNVVWVCVLCVECVIEWYFNITHASIIAIVFILSLWNCILVLPLWCYCIYAVSLDLHMSVCHWNGSVHYPASIELYISVCH